LHAASHSESPNFALNSMPTNLTSLYAARPGALPARFRRERVLIVGCGDVGLRVAGLLRQRARVLALTSTPARCAELRAQGIVPLQGNLDQQASLYRLAGLCTRVIHLAPPPNEGQAQWWRDPRTRALLNVLRLRALPVSLVYGSTSGVYGDCAGDWAPESRPSQPRTPRAQRRADAEHLVRLWGRSMTGAGHTGNGRASILRIPGIYAPDRVGGTPRARLLKRSPVLEEADDVYTNHIHADDLARACVAALWRGRPQRIYNVSDDSQLKMGAYFDLAADIYGLPRPPRVSRESAAHELSVMVLSFMGESRRMDNRRIKRELGFQFKYPTVACGLIESSYSP
jgi:nucleoside-diphosphate-sugar epimerase